jgi:hypothetical protein
VCLARGAEEGDRMEWIGDEATMEAAEWTDGATEESSSSLG